MIQKLQSVCHCGGLSRCGSSYHHSWTKSVIFSCVRFKFIAIHSGRYLESEGHDRSDLNLPGHQHQMIMDAANTSPIAEVSVVIFSAGPVDIAWAVENTQVQSIMIVFYPGQVCYNLFHINFFIFIAIFFFYNSLLVMLSV